MTRRKKKKEIGFSLKKNRGQIGTLGFMIAPGETNNKEEEITNVSNPRQKNQQKTTTGMKKGGV